MGQTSLPSLCIASLFLIAMIPILAASGSAQEYISCYLNFDGNPAGVDAAGCPSYVFLSLDFFNLQVPIGATSSVPGCPGGLPDARQTDEEVRDTIRDVLLATTPFLVRDVGETGLLVRRGIGPLDIVACAVSTSDPVLNVSSLHIPLPALLIDLDPPGDDRGNLAGEDDVYGGAGVSMSVTINGVTTPVSINCPPSRSPCRTDEEVAGRLAAVLRREGYLAISGGSAVAVFGTPDPGEAIVSGSLADPTSLSSMSVVPPLCFSIDPQSGWRGDCQAVTLTGVGFTAASQVLFGGVPSGTVIFDPLTPDRLQVLVPEGAPPGLAEVRVVSSGLEDACVDPFDGGISCGSCITGNVEGVNDLLGMTALPFQDDLEGGDGKWTTSSPTGNGDWTLMSRPYPSNLTTAWVSTDSDAIKDDRLETLSFSVPSVGATLTFQHSYRFMLATNGAVLEASVDGAPFVDLGAQITQGGYDDVIIDPGNPIGSGRSAWTGQRGPPAVPVAVDLSPFAGSEVVLRFRLGCGLGSGIGGGWVIDNVVVRGPRVRDQMTIATDTPFSLDLASAPSGPFRGEYVLWIWESLPTSPTLVAAFGSPIGCFANPTPFNRGATPQPVVCFRSLNLPPLVCRGVPRMPAQVDPPSIPFKMSRTSGSVPVIMTAQALVQDLGAGHPSGYSISNTVTLRVESPAP